jgi:beta-lactamase class A
MRKVVVLCLVLLTLIACAGNPTPNVTPPTTDTAAPATPQVSRLAIEIGRSAARVGLNVTLQKAGLSPAETTAILTGLRTAVDALLAGKDLGAVLADPQQWTSLRDLLTQRLASVIVSGAVVGGVPLYDQASAEVLVRELLDAAVAAIRK